MATPYVMYRLEEVGSTQSEAERLFASGDGKPTLLVADRQTSGRGRHGNRWVTAPRAVAASLALRPGWPPSAWGRIPLVAGLAARAALRSVLGTEVALKWPNDLLTTAGKVGGVLVEASGDRVTVGCGINLWWPDPIPEAAGLVSEDPGPEAAGPLAVDLAQRLLRRLHDDPRVWGHEEYRSVCATLGQQITWDPDGQGEAVDVAADGGLVVETPDGRTTLHSGVVRSVRPRPTR